MHVRSARTDSRVSILQVAALSALFCLLASLAQAQTGFCFVPGELPNCEVPDQAVGPVHPPGSTLLPIDLGGGVFVLTEGVYQALLLIGDDGAILVDGPPSIDASAFGGPTFAQFVGLVAGDVPVTKLVYSHAHKDHIGAAGAIAAAYPGVEVIAHHATGQELAEAHTDDPADPRPLPTTTFKTALTVTAGSQTLELSHLRDFHQGGDVIAYEPSQKVLMAVDLVFPGWVPFVNLALTRNVRNYIRGHDDVLAFDFDHFVGGHLTRIGDRDDVELARDYVHEVQMQAGIALGTNGPDFFNIFQQKGPSPFNAFDEFLDRVSEDCAFAVEADPRFAELGGIGLFTKSHCFTMQNFLRLE